jgi:gamma-glutamyltranspeptidase/glutathione hydrolase
MNSMVACPDALASGAGVAILRAGGNAVDAAIATNAVLAVTTQHMCGMGGDLFAIVVAPGAPPVALNASGRAGSGADPDRLRAEGLTHMPYRGDIRSVPVPGCVDGWCALHTRYGRLALSDVFAPAIAYARDGFPASPLLERSAASIAGLPDTDDYPPGLRAGEVVRRPGVARALEAVGRDGRDAWYAGEFGRALVELGAGEFVAADLQRGQADWVEPLRARVWGHDVWTVPPNSQGYLTLAAAAMADALGVPARPDDGAWAHLLIECAKQAGFDRVAVLHEHADGAALLAPARLHARAAAIDPRRAGSLAAPTAAGGTIHLDAIDADGFAVSLTQSNCAGFGAHIVVPGVRVFLQNRGQGFSLVPGHPAEYAPGRRPPHTLCPTLVTTHDGRVRHVLGTMGADGQPLILLQLLARLLVTGEDPATAVSAARWVLASTDAAPFSVWEDPSQLRVQVEAHAPSEWVPGLRERGHDVDVIERHAYGTGHAHVISVRDDGTCIGAADPRSIVGAAVGS